MVRLASTEGTWSCVSGGSLEIQSVFVFVSVVLGLALPNLQVSSLTTVAALVRWSFVGLARRLPIYQLQQALLRQP